MPDDERHRSRADQSTARRPRRARAGRHRSRSRRARLWSATWPKLAAIGLGSSLWQLVVWSGWKPEYVLPGPGRVLGELWHLLAERGVHAVRGPAATMTRAIVGFPLAVLVGIPLGAAMSRIKLLRTAA